MTVILIVLSILNLALTAAVFTKLYTPNAGDRTRAGVSGSPQRTGEEVNHIDEGFENIMRFEVNGATGFEVEKQWDR